jgi:acyl-CoA synthetase (AMP-forming)/AMP-acid ligase II
VEVSERPRDTLGEALTHSAERHPDKPFFRFPDGSYMTFGEVNSRVNRLVSALRARGVAKGDRIALFARDSHRYAEVMLAAVKMGAPYVPLNYRLTRAEADALIGRTEPTVLMFDARYAELLADSARLTPHAFELDGEDPASSYEALLASGEDVEPEPVCFDSDTAGIGYTSGTTGIPKGAVQSQGMMKAFVASCIAEFDVRADDVRYAAGPMYHVSGICVVFTAAWFGCAMMIAPQFDVDTVIRMLAQERITAMFLVPTMMSMILQRPEVERMDFSRLRLIYYGASPMSPGLLRRAMAVFGCRFIHAFGAGTEAANQAALPHEDHLRALEDRPQLLLSIGKPMRGVSLRIVDEDMKDVPVGEVGEIATRSDMVMDGYLGMPEANAHVFRDGWFRAGDMAYRDEEGYIYLAGRKSDMIIRGGENIYPTEIELALAEHPAVQMSAVVGVPDEHWGETVRAFVILRTGRTASAEELAAHAGERLARFKIPSEFRFVDELPLNASGKVLKRELRNLE